MNSIHLPYFSVFLVRRAPASGLLLFTFRSSSSARGTLRVATANHHSPIRESSITGHCSSPCYTHPLPDAHPRSLHRPRSDAPLLPWSSHLYLRPLRPQTRPPHGNLRSSHRLRLPDRHALSLHHPQHPRLHHPHGSSYRRPPRPQPHVHGQRNHRPHLTRHQPQTDPPPRRHSRRRGRFPHPPHDPVARTARSPHWPFHRNHTHYFPNLLRRAAPRLRRALSSHGPLHQRRLRQRHPLERCLPRRHFRRKRFSNHSRRQRDCSGRTCPRQVGAPPQRRLHPRIFPRHARPLLHHSLRAQRLAYRNHFHRPHPGTRHQQSRAPHARPLRRSRPPLA